jgi:hypothetical protein
MTVASDRRPANAHYTVENLALKDDEMVTINPLDEVVGGWWNFPLTYLTILRYAGNEFDDDE